MKKLFSKYVSGHGETVMFLCADNESLNGALIPALAFEGDIQTPRTDDEVVEAMSGHEFIAKVVTVNHGSLETKDITDSLLVAYHKANEHGFADLENGESIFLEPYFVEAAIVEGFHAPFRGAA